jgi:phosphonate transport system substrate-binding protein
MTETIKPPEDSLGVRRYVLILVAVWTALVVALTGCESREVERIDLRERIDDAELAGMAPKRDSNILRFGFDLRASPGEDARQCLPFLKYLEKETGLRFELRFTPKNGAVVDHLGEGLLEFAAVGSVTYIAAHAEYGVIPVAHGLNAEGRAEYQSVIAVAPDSPIQKIDELRGKRFAFGGLTSTQGHLIPRIILAEHGMRLDDLAGYEYTGSHRNCASAVAAGRFDAGGMQGTMGREMAERGLIRILFTSKFHPSSGIAANKDVSPEAIEKVKRALLDFQPRGKDAEGLYHWDRTDMPNGFTEARDEDYAALREWSIKFGLIDSPAE